MQRSTFVHSISKEIKTIQTIKMQRLTFFHGNPLFTSHFCPHSQTLPINPPEIDTSLFRPFHHRERNGRWSSHKFYHPLYHSDLSTASFFKKIERQAAKELELDRIQLEEIEDVTEDQTIIEGQTEIQQTDSKQTNQTVLNRETN